jgi:hypothetical protein
MCKGGLGAIAAIAVSGAIWAPAANADFVIAFNDYHVGGSLTVKKLKQDVNLPAKSRFNGTVNLTTHELQGHVAIPRFTSTIKIAGIPTEVTTQLKEVQPVQGTFTFGQSATQIDATTSATLYIRKLQLGLLSVRTTCRTADPILLNMDFDGPLVYPIAFDGATTIPRLVHCGVLGPTLTALMSGPDNPYHLTLAPPAF